MRRAPMYGTLIVLVHLLLTLVHGAMHAKLGIDLDSAGLIFVLLVIGLCPLVAMVLLWTSGRTLGLALLAFSMAASLLFGAYHHFLVPGPDYVGQQSPGLAATVFAASSYGILGIEGLGAYISLHYLLKRGDNSD